MMRAGLPTAVAPAGTGLQTTALADAGAVAHREAAQHLGTGPTTTPRPSVGWRGAARSEVPPSVTPW